MSINRVDLICGSFFFCIGAIFATWTLKTVQVGTAALMGPGFFPILLSAFLMVLGILISSQAGGSEQPRFGAVAWRGLFFVGFAPIIYGLTVEGLGLLPSLTLIAFISAFSSPQMRIGYAILLAIGLGLVCVAVFHFGLRLSTPVIGRWIIS
jgi:hypothetical protein